MNTIEKYIIEKNRLIEDSVQEKTFVMWQALTTSTKLKVRHNSCQTHDIFSKIRIAHFEIPTARFMLQNTLF